MEAWQDLLIAVGLLMTSFYISITTEFNYSYSTDYHALLYTSSPLFSFVWQFVTVLSEHFQCIGIFIVVTSF